jgi:NTP pyrophosphatase (non-canonical NTP hydrolase)
MVTESQFIKTKDQTRDEAYAHMVRALFKREGFNANSGAIMHAAIGIAGEAGELIDAVKKDWAYNNPLDRDNVIEELGDLEFYMEALRSELCITRAETLTANTKKLEKRYHSKVYSDAHAQERADKQ